MNLTFLDFFSYKVTQTTCCMQSANLGIPVLSTSWLYSRLSSIILVHSFHMLWLRLSWCVWRFPMHGYLVTSSLIRETHRKWISQGKIQIWSRGGNLHIVSAHVYFGLLILPICWFPQFSFFTFLPRCWACRRCYYLWSDFYTMASFWIY